MPYISEGYRFVLDPHIDNLRRELDRMAESMQSGSFNYIVFTLLLHLTREKNYHGKVGFVGGLIWALMEWYRRFGIPYEDLARARNGDIT